MQFKPFQKLWLWAFKNNTTNQSKLGFFMDLSWLICGLITYFIGLDHFNSLETFHALGLILLIGKFFSAFPIFLFQKYMNTERIKIFNAWFCPLPSFVVFALMKMGL